MTILTVKTEMAILALQNGLKLTPQFTSKRSNILMNPITHYYLDVIQTVDNFSRLETDFLGSHGRLYKIEKFGR